LPKNKSWTAEKESIPQTPYACTLQTFIRHKVHHPENQTMQSSNYADHNLKDSIDEMISLIQSENL
jgi:hypothetical protein